MVEQRFADVAHAHHSENVFRDRRADTDRNFPLPEVTSIIIEWELDSLRPITVIKPQL
jgi:hypothetical protein